VLTRLTTWMGAASVAILLIGGLALAGPGSTDGSSPSSSSSSTTGATAPSTTGSTVKDGSTSSSTSVTMPDDDEVSTTTSTRVVSPSTTSVTLPEDDEVSTTTSTSLPDHEAAVEGTFSFQAGDAGELTVQVSDGRMSLVSTTTNAGWVLEEIRAESDRVLGVLRKAHSRW
jgi:cytoskeletal protein RodZ